MMLGCGPVSPSPSSFNLQMGEVLFSLVHSCTRLSVNMINTKNELDTKIIMIRFKFSQAEHNVVSLDWDGGGGAE